MAAKLNTYQLVCVHTNYHYQPTETSHGVIRYEFLTDFISGHTEALNQLYDLRSELMTKGQPATIIWRDLFFSGTDIYRLLKVDPKLPARHGLQGW